MHPCVYMNRLAVTVQLTCVLQAVRLQSLKCSVDEVYKLDDACSPCSVVYSSLPQPHVYARSIHSVMKTKQHPTESNKAPLVHTLNLAHFLWTWTCSLKSKILLIYVKPGVVLENQMNVSLTMYCTVLFHIQQSRK